MPAPADETKFEECTSCKFFNAEREHRNCKHCGVGEFFEEKVSDRAPTDDELMMMFRKSYYDDQD